MLKQGLVYLCPLLLDSEQCKCDNEVLKTEAFVCIFPRSNRSKFPKVYVPQFLCLQNGNTKATYLIGLYVKYLAQCPPYSKSQINVS